ncbi:MAG: hypothetical protein PUC60_04055 [Clostridiales bacterium]|nr:hypothetical protein [Clostridiales bacterium]
MSENFKKCMFGGFDPEDVIAYIDRTAKENKARIATLTEQNEALTKSNQEMQVELTMLRQQFVDQENENRAAEKWQQEWQAAQEKLQQLEEEAAMLRTQAQEYRSLKDHIADIEISAHRRTEEFRRAAIAQMQEIVNKQRGWCEEMKTKYLAVTEQFSQKLQQAQQVLAEPDVSGFAEMEEGLQNLENSLFE